MERKRSDDIVSLDSWNESISTPESESPKSPADAFMEDANCGKQYGKKRRNHRSRSHSDRDRDQAKQPDSLLLSPSKFLDQMKGGRSTGLACAIESREPDVFQDRLIERESHTGTCMKTKRENEFGKKYPISSSGSSTEDQRQAKIVQGWVGELEEDQPRSVCQRHRSKTTNSQQQHQKYKNRSQQCDRCQQQQSSCGKPKVMSQSWQTQPHQYQPQHHPRYQHPRQKHWMGHERLNNVLQYPSMATYPPTARSTSHSSQNEEDIDQSEKMKNKILSVWNNVRYGWTLKTKTSFKCDSPIFLLGKCYHIRPSDDAPAPGDKICMVPTVEKFKQDFSSQLWFTYRQDFPAITGTKLTSDCGWGCMLRSGQMMVARAFVNHFLDRDWNVFRDQSLEEETFRKQIIRWFGDYPCEQSPFSIHHLVEIGKKLGKDPGDWYGPSSVAHILRDAIMRGYSSQPVLADICIYVAQDSTVYKKDIYEMCTKRQRTVTNLTSSTESETDGAKNKSPPEEEEEWRRAVLIMVPIRLGSEEMNPVYGPCIKSLLAQDNCIGVIGGKPKHSLYFIGFQDDKLIYLDPHYCQEAVDTRERNFPVQSYHCLSPRKVALSKMDPSCTVGFYCKTKKEFETFVTQSEAMVSPPKQKLSYPMFVFSEGRGSELNLDSLSLEEDKLLRIRHVKTDKYGNAFLHNLVLRIHTALSHKKTNTKE
ncbi:Cysteine protease ATG4D [Mizuhopecten yessoensis]|uniref:Cysteine protease n=1 Tax=Mizuhopecten yessoensis TaxID=6573 RepID=A0A210QBH8_MIZYE|nr:Cysteine protease ATG4D [Mizuhopecten yessoensis]